MLLDPMYYAVFYDVTLPKNNKFAMKKQINYFKYMKLIEEQDFKKEVELDKIRYEVLSFSTFNKINTVDNTLYVICNVKKI